LAWSMFMTSMNRLNARGRAAFCAASGSAMAQFQSIKYLPERNEGLQAGLVLVCT
jgi:hypothetical protein